MRTALASSHHHFLRCNWWDQSSACWPAHRSCHSQLSPDTPRWMTSSQIDLMASIAPYLTVSIRLLWQHCSLMLIWSQSRNSSMWSISFQQLYWPIPHHSHPCHHYKSHYQRWSIRHPMTSSISSDDLNLCWHYNPITTPGLTRIPSLCSLVATCSALRRCYF